MSRRAIYAAPWAEPYVDPDRVELVQYGPSARTYARQLERHRAWSWRPPSRAYAPVERDVVRAFMAAARPHMVPEREREVYELVHVQGHSTRWAARALGLSRSAVQTYLRRLRQRAARWRADRESATPNPTGAVRALARHATSCGRAWLDLRAAA